MGPGSMIINHVLEDQQVTALMLLVSLGNAWNCSLQDHGKQSLIAVLVEASKKAFLVLKIVIVLTHFGAMEAQ